MHDEQSAIHPHFEAVRRAAAETNPDFYAAALLAPRHRDHLVALAAYLGEIGRIPLTVHDPHAALIRLQWWRDAIAAADGATLTGNPVADAVLATRARMEIPRPMLLGPLDAAEAELESWDERGEAAFAAYLDDRGAAPFRIAGRILFGRSADEGEPLFRAAGRAVAATRLALDLPYHASERRLPLPAAAWREGDAGRDPFRSEGEAQGVLRTATSWLVEQARRSLLDARSLDRAVFRRFAPAVLPAALVEPHLAALQRPSRDCLREPAGLSPLRRILGLWWASKRARI